MAIPTAYPEEADCIPFVRYVIDKLESNINASFHFEAVFLRSFAEEIRSSVIEHYGASLPALYRAPTEYSPDNILQDNIVIGTWDSACSEINCYAYAIGYDQRVDPAQVEFIEAGNEPYPFDHPVYDSLDTIVGYIRTDLESLGYTVNWDSDSLPNHFMGITEHLRIICIRRETTTGSDYHLMVLSEDGTWTHKLQHSVPLQYLYVPSNSIGWTAEGFCDLGYFRCEDWVYDSDIHYICYRIPCTDCSYIYCGSNKHIYTCNECEETTGGQLACTFIFEYAGNSTHTSFCSECGYTRGLVVPCMYVNGTCQYCGSIQSITQRSALSVVCA